MGESETEIQASRPHLELVWQTARRTKFRTPKLRADIVNREELVRGARALAMERRVTLISAPAGAGKSTLLAQLAGSCIDATTAWLSLDEDDNDPNRLFVSLLTALRDVPLEWEIDAPTLASQVLDDSASSKAAIALLINALCSFEAERLLVILDDLQRLTHPQGLELLSYLIERLPPEVGFVIGARLAPDLPLARWRLQGELGELHMIDLQFDTAAATALAQARLQSAASPELVQEALRRTQGWAAGLQLMLSTAVRSASAPASSAGNRHMFDFLAHEVLAELPEQLREFVLRCSILAELSPQSCGALMPGVNAYCMLDEIYRRNLFVTSVDDCNPILRFHDLFRDFLQRELERRKPDLVRALHREAAQAELEPSRAVAHWLKAECWDESISLMHGCAEPLLAEGGHAMVERWIAQLPPTVRGRHDVVHLQGLCAWVRWDWHEAQRCLETAAAEYRRRGDSAGHLRALYRLPRACNAAGDLESAARLLAEIDMEQLDDRQRAMLTATQAWQALGQGEPDRVAPILRSFVQQVERDPVLLFPAANDMFNSFLFAHPGTMQPMRRLRELAAAQVRKEHVRQEAAPWQVQALACTAWPELWHGERSAASAAIARQEDLTERLSIVQALQLNNLQSIAMYAAATGDFERAITAQQGAMDVIDALRMPMFTRSWRRMLMHDLACVCWIAQSAERLRKLMPELEPDRYPGEWPLVDTGRVLARGRLALLEGNLADAQTAIERACELAERWRLPTFIGDPRISLAMLRLDQGSRSAAWAAFQPAFQDAMVEDCLGPLLMEPRERLDRLLELMPADIRAQPAARSLLQRLQPWRVADSPATASGASGPLRELTSREVEVLARIAAGDSNKLIARALDLSPHTVKRHVANILDKLAVSTRSAAAALYRHHH